jgi:hypothetical protein
MKMRKIIFLTSLLSLSSFSESWKNYRTLIQGSENAKLRATESAERVARILDLLGESGEAARKVRRAFTPAVLRDASIVESRIRSSDFLKSMMQPAILAIYEDRLRGTAMPADTTMGNREIEKKIQERYYETCKFALGEGRDGMTPAQVDAAKAAGVAKMDRALKNFLYLVIDLDKQARDKSGQRIETVVQTSEAAKLVARNLQSYLDLFVPSARTELGHVFGVKVLDGSVRNIYFTKKTDVTIENPKTLPESEMSNITLSLLSSFRNGEDFAFLAIHSCLISRIAERKEVLETEVRDLTTARGAKIRKLWNGDDIQAKRVEISDLERMTTYLEAKKFGAETVSRRMAAIGRDVNKMLALLVVLQEEDVPVAAEMNPMRMQMITTSGNAAQRGATAGAAAGALIPGASKATAELSQTDKDFAFYSNMNNELYRLQEHLRQEAAHKEKLKQAIQSLPGVRQ